MRTQSERKARQDATCRHFQGTNKSYVCGAGIDMRDFNGGTNLAIYKVLPCWGPNGDDETCTPAHCEKVTDPAGLTTYVSHFETCPNAREHSKKVKA